MVYPDTFEGFAVHDTKKWSTVEKIEFKPKPFGPYDVDIKVEACGVCGSDVHTVTGGWEAPVLPVIVGHEIVGKVVKVGDKVTTLKVGDRAGVGAQIWSCLECEICKQGNETYCPKWVDTYNDAYPDGTRTYGGYSSHIRAHEHFAFPIPEKLNTLGVAPMLCAGITTYSPLVRNGAGPGKKVGVVGIGGLGHFAIMWAKALGCEVYVFSRSSKKKADALQLGADHFVATGEGENWNSDLKYKLDMIISTANSTKNFDFDAYAIMLKVHAKFIAVGLPEDQFQISGGTLLKNGCYIGSSHLGSRQEMIDMLNLAAEKGIESWYEAIAISKGGIKEALERCHDGDVKYRFTLSDYSKEFA
ncbi:NADPH-dependent alcohol dehydrogenase [Scheffersomyces xylosifermentans]|uniref:NADPH-dependent alcohol dehydrogenase n=1 Tax=Scheffersomyces xylosifermentans TaxID=1304137 RepID=UPI00315C4F6F